ncbi:Alpha/beta hydrolase family-domain-containing protein [Geopyxis carbonaria]|nr:Alpha/beta hydrolase family-domain-containing protein [Geopyxis carbonaria]
MALYDIVEHVIPASHIREYPRATTSGLTDTRPLRLAVKQYVPKQLTHGHSEVGSVTLVFCHANAFHKELYEAYFDDLLIAAESQGLSIRSIWAADAAHQGMSGILNERELGDDPCWNDFSRDTIHMINTFADQMPPPIIGVGHSFGGHAIARAALMHPSLFTSIVLIDPVIEESEVIESGYATSKLSAKRIDVWRTRSDAENYFRSRKFYQRWDPRVLKAHLKYGLRDLPTMIYPDQAGVTLATTKHQEVYTFLRCTRAAHPDMERPLDRDEPGDTWRLLHMLVPHTLYIVGGDSPVSTELVNKRKIMKTRSAEITVINETGHLVPQEKPIETAKATIVFLSQQLQKWNSRLEEDRRTNRSPKLPSSVLKLIAKM